MNKATFALTPEFMSLIDEAVDGGEYANKSEVVRDALRVWDSGRKSKAERLAFFRKAIRDGINSGPSVQLSVDEVMEYIDRINAKDA